jgi:hypothetical protein
MKSFAGVGRLFLRKGFVVGLPAFPKNRLSIPPFCVVPFDTVFSPIFFIKNII